MSSIGDGGSSVDLSIVVVEAGANDSFLNRGSSNSFFQQKQKQQLSFPVPCLHNSSNGSFSGTSGDAIISGRGEAGQGDGSPQGAAVCSCSTKCKRDDENCSDEQDKDDMAERVLHTLQRKDELLAEQAQCLEQREKEVEELHREKRLLLHRLHICLCNAKSSEAAGNHETASQQQGKGEDGALESWRLEEQERLLVCADSQLRDERAERQQDAGHFRAHIDQLTAQLHQAQRDASAREAKHAQDLEAIHREMQEFSTLADEMHAARGALQRTEAQLEEVMEAKTQCQLERDRLVRMLQNAMRNERVEQQRLVYHLREKVQASQQVVAAAEEKCRSAEAVRETALEEVRTLRHDLRCVVSEQAVLTLEMDAAEERMRQAQQQRAAAVEEQQRLRAELDSALQEVTQLRAARDAQHLLLEEDDRRRESLSVEVAQCAHGAQKLEEVIMEMERRRQEAAAREACVSEERDRLRTQLQQISANSRRELLEQQQLAEEMGNFHRAKLQQLHQAVEHQRQRAEQLQQESAVAREAWVVLHSILERAQQRLEETVAELEPLRERAAALETALAAAQEAHRGCAAREGENAEQLNALRVRLQQREQACRKLKMQVERLEKCEQQRRLLSASNSLIRHINRQRQHQQEQQQGLEHALYAQRESVSNLSQSNTSTTGTMPPPHGSVFDQSRERLQALETQNAKLEQQLSAKQNGYRSLLDERKVLMRQMHTMQAGVQQQISALERQHRGALKHLEEVHRRRTLSVCHEVAEEAKRRESHIRRGIAHIVTELMAFISALEVHMAASAGTRCHDDSQPMESIIMQEKKEGVLRAACDSIARNFLGVEGGWESLLQHPSCNSNKKSSSSSLATRRRIRSLLSEYLQLKLLENSTPASAPSVVRCSGGGGGDQRMAGFGVASLSNTIDDHENDDDNHKHARLSGERSSHSGQPLRELLMEGLGLALDDDAL